MEHQQDNGNSYRATLRSQQKTLPNGDGHMCHTRPKRLQLWRALHRAPTFYLQGTWRKSLQLHTLLNLKHLHCNGNNYRTALRGQQQTSPNCDGHERHRKHKRLQFLRTPNRAQTFMHGRASCGMQAVWPPQVVFGNPASARATATPAKLCCVSRRRLERCTGLG